LALGYFFHITQLCIGRMNQVSFLLNICIMLKGPPFCISGVSN